MRRAAFVLALICLLAFAARVWNVRDVFVEGAVYFVDADCYSRMTRARLVADGRGLFIRRHDFENWPQGTRPHTTAPMDWAIVIGQKMIATGLGLLDPGRTSVLRSQTLDLSGALVSPILGLAACAWLACWAASLRASGAGVPPAMSGAGVPPAQAGAGETPAPLPTGGTPAPLLRLRSLGVIRGAWMAVPFFFAISPALVHGTLLGRPDHQSLVLLLLAVALSAELSLAATAAGAGDARGGRRRWSVIAGCGWAVALWVSLYEPLVLFAAMSLWWLAFDRRRFTAAEHRPGWIAFAAIVGTAAALDGWRLSWPDPALRSAFANWKQTIGELAHLDPRSPLLYRWVGALVVPAPVLLFLAARRDRRALLVLGLLVITFGLTVWQVRWCYFLALVFALSLPWQLAALRKWWIAWPVFVIALWPMAQDWDEKLFPEDHPELDSEKQRGVLRLEKVRLREVAALMRSADRRPFLAPWWLSPPLAYWSQQPGVAGSSHQSLPGIVATARFFLAPGPADAGRIARELGVKWVVTDDPDRLVATSRPLFAAAAGMPYVVHLHEAGQPRERVTGEDLKTATPEARARLLEMADRAEAAALGSAAFSCVSTNQFYKLFSVNPDKVQSDE
ncbi:MAG: hypothetical protein QOE70_5001 [Chthoniobacter sp.]|nr:hypothetical protein [Chthoniobacter sp.]